MAVLASASMLGLVACNAIFGLDPLTYEPRPSVPLPPEEADAGDGSADGDPNEADAADGARMDAVADGADATSQADADPSDAADD